jgi:aromatic ring-opening dioxygenase catalytic subunit (LigB family)
LAGYGMDDLHVFDGAPDLARELIGRLLEKDVDVAAAGSVPDASKRGFGHAFGFVAKRLFRGRRIPMLPILLNTYFPPNAPTPARCYRIGQALRAALEECTADLRVAIVGSGGLSHFICEPELDRKVLTALQNKDAATLAAMPRAALQQGSSEILAWIAAGGALEGLDVSWSEYIPVHRTPAGTGIGLAFMAWS